jgi:hypothetical protein
MKAVRLCKKGKLVWKAYVDGDYRCVLESLYVRDIVRSMRMYEVVDEVCMNGDAVHYYLDPPLVKCYKCDLIQFQRTKHTRRPPLLNVFLD